ncbi:hypothetical protein BASA50_007111 [Batrachochytrium salamandrivorans]|uniref:Uncharacterized protein n=1 Tax=Batrachochytrium salamandrivorans TaxID=1357716 RepID=A0ABQ8F855_9FUNG|nr:hypothetical protein BASA60_005172 [Batrachochytrium salamandrivorans]KAH6578980.1 hypothetical protein BASA61_010560 [Batrachochytrium salamandrivorans]KAH6593886.1 hypothetical protein BASA50_007111 [Batrachochytrium salamandrivorans]KAH9272274.1 hypothetical protein BASA83_005366 [Batrachochytrium salamandrivorans]KAJ1328365.1 hypothetical protein BSLG_010097 [Batrachochytrium salamandrivorans]
MSLSIGDKSSRLADPFKTLHLSFPSEWVLHVELARTKQLNTMSMQFFVDIMDVFEAIRLSSSVRAVILSASLESRLFTAGLDLKEVQLFPQQASDPAREALKFIPSVELLQRSFSAIEACNKPVIAAVHGFCIGGGIDMITACDVRMCSKDAVFSVKEVDIGIAADLGTLQRLPKVVGNDSWAREICFTGRMVPAAEALQFGLVSRVLDDKEQLIHAALTLATQIASKAPIAVYGTKHLLNHGREHTINEGLQYAAIWNSVMLNSPDTLMQATAAMTKSKSNHEGELNGDGVFTGDGTAAYHSGHKYQGGFKSGLLNGTGKYEWSDGITYKGQFQDNKIMGSGTYTWNDGCSYQGELQDSLRHGVGKFEHPDRACSYSGGWRARKPNGQGLLRYDEKTYYQGEWKDGRRDGVGIMCYSSGNVYDGQWRDGVKSGIGKMIWKDRCEEYSGEWKNGKPNGTGTYIWRMQESMSAQYPMQNRYQGDWIDGMRHGAGVFQYSTGAIYKGEWVSNMKHGKGVFKSEYGRQYIGEFLNDRPLERFTRFSNTTPYVFAVTSKDNGQESIPEKALKEIHAVIFRHLDILCKVYHYYSQMTPRDPDNPKLVLTLESIWRFFTDIGIVNRGFTLAGLDRSFSTVFKDDPLFGDRYQNDIIPTMTRLEDEKQRVRSKAEIVAERTHKYFKEKYELKIEQLYIDLAKKHTNSLPNSKGDNTITIRELILILKKYKVLGNPKWAISIPFVIQHCAKSNPNVIDGDCYSLEHEILHVDVFEVIYQSGLHTCIDTRLEMDKLLNSSGLGLVDLEAYLETAFETSSGFLATEKYAENEGGIRPPISGISASPTISILATSFQLSHEGGSFPLAKCGDAEAANLANSANAGIAVCTVGSVAKLDTRQLSTIQINVPVESRSSTSTSALSLSTKHPQSSTVNQSASSLDVGPTDDQKTLDCSSREYNHLDIFHKMAQSIHTSVTAVFEAIIQEHSAHQLEIELVDRYFIRKCWNRVAAEAALAVRSKLSLDQLKESLAQAEQ